MTIRSASDQDLSITYDLYRTEYQAYQKELDTYLLYHNASKSLVKQIVAAVPLLYIENLEDNIFKFGNIFPFEILEHLPTTYEEVTAEDLDKNIKYMNHK